VVTTKYRPINEGNHLKDDKRRQLPDFFAGDTRTNYDDSKLT